MLHLYGTVRTGAGHWSNSALLTLGQITVRVPTRLPVIDPPGPQASNQPVLALDLVFDRHDFGFAPGPRQIMRNVTTSLNLVLHGA